ncbi:MAG: hypothetical protein JW958_04855 [Candidatus Eisenbacteria bacterium]|nr:hypothetical protein [Candidatus Eisenbacteria bacterium]
MIVGVFGASLASGAEIPDPPFAGPEGPFRLDPNRSPLPLLSRAAGVGTEGARRIGERRAAGPIRDAGDLRLLLGDPEELREEAFSYPGEGARDCALRLRRESTGSGVRDTRAFEGSWGVWEAGVLTERDPGESRPADFLAGSVLADLGGGEVVPNNRTAC